MTKKQYQKEFIDFYGGRKPYKKALNEDRCSVALDFSIYIDQLNRDGQITDKQRFYAELPK